MLLKSGFYRLKGLIKGLTAKMLQRAWKCSPLNTTLEAAAYSEGFALVTNQGRTHSQGFHNCSR